MERRATYNSTTTGAAAPVVEDTLAPETVIGRCYVCGCEIRFGDDAGFTTAHGDCHDGDVLACAAHSDAEPAVETPPPVYEITDQNARLILEVLLRDMEVSQAVWTEMADQADERKGGESDFQRGYAMGYSVARGAAAASLGVTVAMVRSPDAGPNCLDVFRYRLERAHAGKERLL